MAGSGLYVWSAVQALGSPDRSVVFWYSGFLVFGIALSAAGISLLLVLAADVGREPVLPRRLVRVGLWVLGLAGALAAAAGIGLAGWHLLAAWT